MAEWEVPVGLLASQLPGLVVKAASFHGAGTLAGRLLQGGGVVQGVELATGSDIVNL